MCVALPGRVIEIEGTTAVVDFQGNRVRAEAGLVCVKPGDSVLVHAGCILQVLSEEEGKQLTELFAGNGMIGYVAKERVDGKLILPEAVQILTITGSAKAAKA